MSINDKQIHTNYKNQKSKMPHMFQKSNQDTNLVNDDIDLLPQHQHNLSKIVKSYQSSQKIDLKGENNTLVSTVKNLLETQTTEEINSLYDYLEQLKGNYVSEKVLDVDEQIDLEPDNDETNFEIEVSTEQDHNNDDVNINDILHKSEQEIINTTDQKSLLKSLIDDINLNSSSNTNNDDSLLEDNMNEIIDETVEEDFVADEIKKTTSDNQQTKPTVKKKILPSILLIMFFILLAILIFLYRETILEFIQKILLQLNIQGYLNI
ncbi:hypothetical protein KHQ81_08805 [Mycoplasmatota bacterium]|nr:hypothetical protein KHQ81_08805 [Mycoplasmatota bacterium]